MTNYWIKCPLELKHLIQKYIKWNLIKELKDGINNYNDKEYGPGNCPLCFSKYEKYNNKKLVINVPKQVYPTTISYKYLDNAVDVTEMCTDCRDSIHCLDTDWDPSSEEDNELDNLSFKYNTEITNTPYARYELENGIYEVDYNKVKYWTKYEYNSYEKYCQTLKWSTLIELKYKILHLASEKIIFTDINTHNDIMDNIIELTDEMTKNNKPSGHIFIDNIVYDFAQEYKVKKIHPESLKLVNIKYTYKITQIKLEKYNYMWFIDEIGLVIKN